MAYDVTNGAILNRVLKQLSDDAAGNEGKNYTTTAGKMELMTKTGVALNQLVEELHVPRNALKKFLFAAGVDVVHTHGGGEIVHEESAKAAVIDNPKAIREMQQDRMDYGEDAGAFAALKIKQQKTFDQTFPQAKGKKPTQEDMLPWRKYPVFK